MPDLTLNVRKHMTGIGLIPAPIEVLGGEPQLDNEVARQVLWFDLATLFLPKAQQGTLVLAHDGADVRPANEVTPGCLAVCPNLLFHG